MVKGIYVVFEGKFIKRREILITKKEANNTLLTSQLKVK
ncbi:hypothetical protein B4088_3992 [Bacillus cereus]|uniref:Uncharacterized protein n=1 Tax=Bacillus cereus TaxID=1396 RepID=A0A164MQV8_BACCE|nr:hypothetical protein B4088_3992 [Bacillus cereus]